jgi:hypothetical protein
MLAPEMTLAAALRDSVHADARVRGAGVRSLAPALVVELGRAPPVWCDDGHHRDAVAVRERLVARLDDAQVEIAGHAALGLGTLGRPEVLDRARAWLAIDRDDDDARWLHETAVIAASYVGVAARGRDAELHARVVTLLREAWKSPHADIRFQAAMARVEIDDPKAEQDLSWALARESSPLVREQIVDALGHLDRVEPSTLDRVATLLATEDASQAIGMSAAMLLASHGRDAAVDRLIVAVGRRHERDDALEALAGLGPVAAAATDAAEALLGRWLVPPVTRVRAAFALCRIAPQGAAAQTRAERALRRWAFHPRRAVREAVADARRALDGLRSPPP